MYKEIINSGWCYQFAVVMKQLNPKAQLRMCYCHAWATIDGVHYDSDHRHGKNKDLCIRGSCEVKSVSLKELVKTCKTWGNSGPVNMKIIRKVVKEYKRSTKKAA